MGLQNMTRRTTDKPAQGACEKCGHTVVLRSSQMLFMATVTCHGKMPETGESCGAIYNLSGQRLKPPGQWRCPSGERF